MSTPVTEKATVTTAATNRSATMSGMARSRVHDMRLRWFVRRANLSSFSHNNSADSDMQLSSYVGVVNMYGRYM